MSSCSIASSAVSRQQYEGSNIKTGGRTCSSSSAFLQLRHKSTLIVDEASSLQSSYEEDEQKSQSFLSLFTSSESEGSTQISEIDRFNEKLGELAKEGKAAEAEKLLWELLDEDNNNSDVNKTINIKPDETTYRHVMMACAKAQFDDRGDETAQRILALLPKRDPRVKLCRAYTIAIEVFVDQFQRLAAETLLHDMLNSDHVPDLDLFLVGFRAYNLKTGFDVACKATRLLDYMIFLGIQPNTECFNAELFAWTRCDHIAAGERVDARLAQMKEMELGDRPRLINEDTYYWAMLAWKRSRHYHFQKSPERVEALLYEMLDATDQSGQNRRFTPARKHFLVAISAWMKSLKSNDRGHRVDHLLDKMKEMALDDPNLTPDTAIYNDVVSTWAFSGNYLGARKAKIYVDEMEQLYEKGENLHCQPNIATYRAYMTSLKRSSDFQGGVRGDKLLAKMKTLYANGDESMKLTRDLYKELICAWAYSSDDRAVGKAEGYLKEMWDLYEKGELAVRPNARVYESVFDAWQCNRPQDPEAVERSIQLLEELFQKFDQGLEDCFPRRVMWCLVLELIRDSRHPERPQLAWEVIQMMEKRKLSPKSNELEAALRTCKHCKEEKRAETFQIAWEIYQRIHAARVQKLQNYIDFFATAQRHLNPEDWTEKQEIREAIELCHLNGFAKDEKVDRILAWMGLSSSSK